MWTSAVITHVLLGNPIGEFHGTLSLQCLEISIRFFFLVPWLLHTFHCLFQNALGTEVVL